MRYILKQSKSKAYLPQKEIEKICLDILSALIAMHGRKPSPIIHRAIHLSDFLITKGERSSCPSCFE